MRLVGVFSNLLLAGLVGSWAYVSGSPGDLEPGAGDLRTLTQKPRSAQQIGSTRRIASAALLADELLLELVPKSRIAAVSFLVDEATITPLAGSVPRDLPRIGAAVEQVLELDPDLVVISDYSRLATANVLEAAGVSVFSVRAPTGFEELLVTIEQLGARVQSAQTARVTGALRARLHELARLPKVKPAARALLLQGSFSYAAGSLQHDCLRRAGLVNALDFLGVSGTPELNVELLLAARPDVVFIAHAGAPERMSALPAGYPWHVLPAYPNRIFAVPEAWMASISHHALAACEAYARLVREAE